MSEAFAIEVVLLHALTVDEAAAVQAGAPGHYAFSHDRKHAITVLTADTAAAAAALAWEQAARDALPPVDVVSTVHPDRQERIQVLLNLDGTVEERLRSRAEAARRSMDTLVEEAIQVGLKQESGRRQAAAATELRPLLQRYSLEEVLMALTEAVRAAD